MFSLKDKTIIITGGAGLLGSTFSKVCAEYGTNVVIVDIDEERANELAEQIKKETGNNNIIFQKYDITIIEDIQELINATLNKFERIDALVNNAYPRNKNYGRRLEDVSFEDFCENVNMHLGGYFLITKEISKVMMKQNYGNIINMASIYGFSAPRFEIYEGANMTMPVEYAAIKGGILNLTKYLASYLGRYNIRVNAISPGGVFNDKPESFVKKYSEKVVLGKRMANTDDLIGVLLFLLSDASKYITGQNIVVDGGFTL
ncbi:MAG: flagellin modification protein A [Candidatus Neomarinimicrobiota bacterium]|nr:MAG: flagellin modification protein A [Candidatus Neomarinimicrobiota bacterium]